jgi:hypothetical protein
MRHFFKTTWPIILLVILFLATGFFAFQWWQVKGELGKKIEENENLVKQINELQVEIDKLKKEIEELKTSEKKTPTIPADWKTYGNKEYGFEIDIPVSWEFSNFGDLNYLLSSECFNYSCQQIVENAYECFYGEIYALDFEKEITTNSGAKGCQATRFRGYPAEALYIIFPLKSGTVKDCSLCRKVLILSYLKAEVTPEKIKTLEQIASTFRFIK